MAPVAVALDSLATAGIDVAVYDEVKVEPDKDSLMAAARFVQEGAFDGFVSVGGGSVIDTCKGASMYGTYPAEPLDYVPPPNGAGKALPGPLKPHLACPTTAGTGSEVTPLAVVGYPELNTKIPLLSRHIIPAEAIVDPTCTYSLPDRIVAASAFDLLSHALEAYTARPFSRYPKAPSAGQRIPIQGANPWSDMCAREALRIAGRFLVRSVADADDREARDQMAWAATLAGIGFGNTGTHAPHAMGYPVASLNKAFGFDDYPTKPMIPHGFAVIVNSPSLFRFTAQATPERHLAAAAELGAEARGAGPEDAGEVVAGRLIELMKATGMPNGIGGLGYGAADVADLANLCKRQRRALGNAPRDIDLESDDLDRLYAGALSYW